MTTWMTLIAYCQRWLSRESLRDSQRCENAVRLMAKRLPTYITLKEVKKRWGNGQEDIYPVAQFEKLWGDMTSLPEIDCSFFISPIQRGQQLKSQAQLDGWKEMVPLATSIPFANGKLVEKVILR